MSPAPSPEQQLMVLFRSGDYVGVRTILIDMVARTPGDPRLEGLLAKVDALLAQQAARAPATSAGVRAPEARAPVAPTSNVVTAPAGARGPVTRAGVEPDEERTIVQAPQSAWAGPQPTGWPAAPPAAPGFGAAPAAAATAPYAVSAPRAPGPMTTAGVGSAAPSLAEMQARVMAEPLRYAYAYLQAGRLTEALQLFRIELANNPSNRQVRDQALAVARRLHAAQTEAARAQALAQGGRAPWTEVRPEVAPVDAEAEVTRAARLADEARIRAERQARIDAERSARRVTGGDEAITVRPGEDDAEVRRAEQAARAADAARAAEAASAAERARAQAEERARVEEADRIAEETRAAEALRAEAARRAEESRLAEASRAAEAERLAEAARRAEESRLAEAARAAEEARLAEASRAAEAARLAEAARRAEEARLAAASRAAEAARLAEAARAAEDARLAEATRLTEASRVAEAAQLAEAARAPIPNRRSTLPAEDMPGESLRRLEAEVARRVSVRAEALAREIGPARGTDPIEVHSTPPTLADDDLELVASVDVAEATGGLGVRVRVTPSAHAKPEDPASGLPLDPVERLHALLARIEDRRRFPSAAARRPASL